MKEVEKLICDKGNPANIYLLKFNTRRHWRRPGVFIVNFEHSVSFIDFGQVNISWEGIENQYFIFKLKISQYFVFFYPYCLS